MIAQNDPQADLVQQYLNQGADLPTAQAYAAVSIATEGRSAHVVLPVLLAAYVSGAQAMATLPARWKAAEMLRDAAKQLENVGALGAGTSDQAALPSAQPQG